MSGSLEQEAGNRRLDKVLIDLPYRPLVDVIGRQLQPFIEKSDANLAFAYTRFGKCADAVLESALNIERIISPFLSTKVNVILLDITDIKLLKVDELQRISTKLGPSYFVVSRKSSNSEAINKAAQGLRIYYELVDSDDMREPTYHMSQNIFVLDRNAEYVDHISHSHKTPSQDDFFEEAAKVLHSIFSKNSDVLTSTAQKKISTLSGIASPVMRFISREEFIIAAKRAFKETNIHYAQLSLDVEMHNC